MLLALAGLRCAHVEPPSGGPEDTKPPVVAAVYPAPGARNVPLDAPVVFQFTEWIDRSGARNLVFISPPSRGKLRVKAEADKLQVRPSETAGGLRPGTGYQVTVLGSLKDLHGVFLGKAFSLRFSTGANLDSASLSGTAASAAPQGTRMAALYRVRDRDSAEALSIRDTGFRPAAQPEPWRELPLFLAAADSLGAFRFDSVSQGDYALFAFEDMNGNFAFDLGFEAAAAGPLSVALRPRGPDQMLRVTPSDTLPLRPQKVEFAADTLLDSATVTGKVRLEFSRAAHPLRAAEAGRYRLLSDSGGALPVLSAAWNPLEEAWVLEVPPLRAGRDYRIEVRRPDFPGRNGDSRPDTSLAFTAEAGKDTSTWSLAFLGHSASTGLPVVATVLSPGSEFTVGSDRPLSPARWKLLEERLEARVDTAPVPLKLTRVNVATFSISLSRPLPRGSALSLGLKPASGDSVPVTLASGRTLDSATAGGLRFTPPARWAGWKFRLEGADAGAVALPGVGDAVASAELAAGVYRLVAFRDDDGDGIWNPGALKPWIPQEPFAEVLDSVIVSPRLTTDLTERLKK